MGTGGGGKNHRHGNAGELRAGAATPRHLQIWRKREKKQEQGGPLLAITALLSAPHPRHPNPLQLPTLRVRAESWSPSLHHEAKSPAVCTTR